MNNQNEVFRYSYSAKQQEEVRRIREKYLPPEEDKLEQLRRLDAGVTRRATAVSLSTGIAGCLIMGLGMSCCMVWGGRWFLPGIVIGLAGIACMAVSFPIYRRMVQKERQRIAPLILQLTDELMK